MKRIVNMPSGAEVAFLEKTRYGYIPEEPKPVRTTQKLFPASSKPNATT